MRWEDIDFDRGQIHIRHALAKRTLKEAAARGGERWLLKTPKSAAGCRVVDMVPTVRDALELHRLGAPPADKNPFGLVFTRPGKNGLATPWDPELLSHVNYVKVCKAAKVRVLRLHDCRHTFTALRLASGTTDVKYVQRQLGHANISMTLDTYGHLFQEASAKETGRLQREVDAILAEAAKAEAGGGAR